MFFGCEIYWTCTSSCGMGGGRPETSSPGPTTPLAADRVMAGIHPTCQLRWSSIFNEPNPSLLGNTKSVPYFGFPGHCSSFLIHSFSVTAILLKCQPLQECCEKWVSSLPPLDCSHFSFFPGGTPSPGWAAQILETFRPKGLFTVIAPAQEDFSSPEKFPLPYGRQGISVSRRKEWLPGRTWGFLSYFSMEQRRNKTFLRHKLNAWWGHAAECMWHSDIKLLCFWVAAHLELFNLHWTLASVMQFMLII